MKHTSWELRRLEGFSPRPGPVVAVVMDGIGVGRDDEGNAVRLARTPVLDRLMATCPWTTLAAHGTAVGLPSDADMGNSEVGHNALGAGRVFAQGAKLVNAAIASGALFAGATWRALVRRTAEGGGALHFIGLLSDGNVHSHIDQLFALVERAHADGVGRLFVHPLLDGRDVPETSALDYVDALEAKLAAIDARDGRIARIASGGGRMNVTMDRYEANWAVVETGWRTHVHGDGERWPSARAAIEELRRRDPGVADQFLPPFVVGDGEGPLGPTGPVGPVGPIRDGDGVVFFNFRGDRAIEISKAFEADDFPYFDRGRRPDVLYAGMMEYDGDYHIPKNYLVEPPAIERTMGEYLARNGVRQLACAETQKFGHVTYFWNGNRGGMFDETRERYVEVRSDQVPFEQRPWMKAAEVTDEVVAAIRGGDYPFIRLNYANGDMVGHTGVLEAAILAVAAVDLALGRLLAAVEKARGVALVLADHGNADEMLQRDKKRGGWKRDAAGRLEPKTSHTLNPVPFVLYDPASTGTAGALRLRDDVPRPGLAHFAATALRLLGFEPPRDYEPSLLRLPVE